MHPPPAVAPVLDRMAFAGRVAGELARLRRKGGFLSLLVIGSKAEPGFGARAAVSSLLTALTGRVRLHDVLAQLDSSVAVLMPQAAATEATRAAERLLRTCIAADAEGRTRPAAGLACIFGGVEGDGPALLAAADEALQEAHPGQAAWSRSLQGRPWVLVVDDDKSFAEALAESISERGWEAHPCSNLEDALQRIEEPRYSALFVDLVLGRGNGLDVLRKALRRHPKRPAVLMSGYGTDQPGILAALELGPVIFAAKPISSADLDSALEMFASLLPGVDAGARRS